jgi:hypothetical protein
VALIKKKLVEILHGLPWIMLLGHLGNFFRSISKPNENSDSLRVSKNLKCSSMILLNVSF